MGDSEGCMGWRVEVKMEPSRYLTIISILLITFGFQSKSVCCEGDRDTNSARHIATGYQGPSGLQRQKVKNYKKKKKKFLFFYITYEEQLLSLKYSRKFLWETWMLAFI